VVILADGEYEHEVNILHMRTTNALNIRGLRRHVKELGTIQNSLVPGARGRRKSAWYTLFAHASKFPEILGKP